jgi:hypothetical protein
MAIAAAELSATVRKARRSPMVRRPIRSLRGSVKPTKASALSKEGTAKNHLSSRCTRSIASRKRVFSTKL